MVGNGGLDNSSVLHNIKVSTGLVRSQVSFISESAQAFDKGILRSCLISGLIEPYIRHQIAESDFPRAFIEYVYKRLRYARMRQTCLVAVFFLLKT